MNVVNICAFAEGRYSGSTYEENVSISQDTYNALKEEIDKIEIYIGELDGKHSDSEADVEIQHFTEEEIKNTDWTSNNDGDVLFWELDEIFKKHNLNLQDEVNKVQDFVDSLDTFIEITVTVHKSNAQKVRAFCENL